MTQDVDTVLWMDTVIKLGGEKLNQFLECLMLLRKQMIDTGTAMGFQYPPEAKRTPPFQVYARPDMENFIALFDSAEDITPTFRKVTYPMDVSEISLSGLRYKVSHQPEIWILAKHTQGGP